VPRNGLRIGRLGGVHLFAQRVERIRVDAEQRAGFRGAASEGFPALRGHARDLL
jgi:hypothetical protein